MQYDKNNLIKSPFNYVGGKYKLLPQILELLPNNIDKFIDLFCGGANVGVNIKANKIICNDIINYLIEFYEYLKYNSYENIIIYISDTINEFNLDKTNKDAYDRFRNHYNKNKFILDLYILSCYSFNNRIRFNNKHEFNESFGKREFNENIKNNLISFLNKIKNINIEFTNYDFSKFNFEYLSKHDFVYCDPPYLISTVAYNDGKRGFKGWGENEENKLYELLDELNEYGVKFALSNVTENKGQMNTLLIEWSKKYNIHNINADYHNAHHSKKDKSKGKTKEVLITNY